MLSTTTTKKLPTKMNGKINVLENIQILLIQTKDTLLRQTKKKLPKREAKKFSILILRAKTKKITVQRSLLFLCAINCCEQDGPQMFTLNALTIHFFQNSLYVIVVIRKKVFTL